MPKPINSFRVDVTGRICRCDSALGEFVNDLYQLYSVEDIAFAVGYLVGVSGMGGSTDFQVGTAVGAIEWESQQEEARAEPPEEETQPRE